MKRIVAIFGAGASVPYGLPTLAGLPDVVRAFAATLPDGSLKRAYNLARAFAAGLWGIDIDREFCDYEQLLGAIIYACQTGAAVRGMDFCLTPEDISEIQHSLPSLLFCAIDAVSTNPAMGYIDLKTRDIYRSFLETIHSIHNTGADAPGITCLTLNYDGFLDDEFTDFLWGAEQLPGISFAGLTILPNYGVPLAYATDGVRLATNSPLNWRTSQRHQLIKLHGSFDWLSCGNCGAVHHIRSLYAYLDRLCPSAVRDSPERAAKSLMCVVCSGPLGHTLVAPVLGKYISSVSQILWRASFAALSNASSIYVVGYSFPPSDAPFRMLVQHALNWNDAKPDIFVIDPRSDDEFIKRLESIFPSHARGRLDHRQCTLVEFLRTPRA